MTTRSLPTESTYLNAIAFDPIHHVPNADVAGLLQVDCKGINATIGLTFACGNQMFLGWAQAFSSESKMKRQPFAAHRSAISWACCSV